MARPILVTGSHRSGTTWVGRVVAAAGPIGYIHEPFNLTTSQGVCPAPFRHWFTYVTRENEADFTRPLARTLAHRYSLRGALTELRNGTPPLKLWSEYRRTRRNRMHSARPLMKDPIALLSAEWLADRFGMDVVVMIRHPAAFAHSLKRLDWNFPFRNLLEQPLLMRDHLQPFEAEIRAFARQKPDIVDQAALLWAILYFVVDGYRDRRDDWLFVRQEDLAAEPVERFAGILRTLDLPYTPEVREVVRRSSSSRNPTGVPDDPHCTTRDSRATIKQWQRHLSASEIERVRQRVEPVSRLYYRDEDWE